MAKATARDLALEVLRLVDEEGAYANLALNQVLERHRPGKLDRAFATELTYGTLRTLNTLDWVLGHFLRQPLEKQTAWVRNILRLGVYQIMHMDRVPDSAACNESAEMARRYAHSGAVKFVNGVLRNVARKKGDLKFPDAGTDPVGHISLRYSHPAWLVKRWLSEFGFDETVALCRANNEPAPNTVRTNTLRTTRDNLAACLREDGLTVEETGYAPEGLNISGFLSLHGFKPFEAGYFQVQDESSMLVGHAAAPKAGWEVIDTASAPGGKATHLAQLMSNHGHILATDIHPHKLNLIKDNCQRLGITCVEPMQADARELHKTAERRADLVLVDAPCSGLGVLRRRPDARWRKEAAQIPEIVKLQAEILDSASRCLKPGGVLIYSTCTITREENLEQVENFLAKHKEFELEDLTPYLDGALDIGNTLQRGYIQILPHHHGIDGFFISRLRLK